MLKTVAAIVVLAGMLLAHGFLAGAAAPRTSLRGTRQSQLVQNKRADRDHLSRMTDQKTLERFKRLELVVPVSPNTKDYYIHAIPAQYRYLRPWSKLFLDRLSSQFRRRFGRPLRVTSLTRTSAYQNNLARRNGNAAAAVGEKRSSHLTGASLDISKKGMTGAQQRWPPQCAGFDQSQRLFVCSRGILPAEFPRYGLPELPGVCRDVTGTAQEEIGHSSFPVETCRMIGVLSAAPPGGENLSEESGNVLSRNPAGAERVVL